MANPYFNATYYLANNPDVFAAGINTAEGAWAHYEQYGAAEALNGVASRSPAPWFDIVYYRAENPDLNTAGLTAAQLFSHFTEYGLAEGRSPSAAAGAVNAETLAAYAAANEDLRTAFGIKEGEEPTQAQLVQLAQHFYQFGYKENRDGLPAEFSDGTPGQTFTLTTGVDDITGTSGDDTFRAFGDNDATLQSWDILDGGAGNDVLNIAAGGLVNGAAPVIKNIEVINNESIGTYVAEGGLDLSNVTGVQEVWTDFGGETSSATGGSAVLYTGAKAGTVFGLSGLGTHNYLKIDPPAEEVNIALADNAQTGYDYAFIVLGDNETSGSSGVETINIDSDESSTAALQFVAADDSVTNLVLTGAGNLQIGANSAGNFGTYIPKGLVTIDASGASGDITINASLLADLETATFGSGADTVIAAISDEADTTFDLGAGSDEFTLNGAAGEENSLTTITLGEGNDTVSINALANIASATESTFANGLISITDFNVGEDLLNITGGSVITLTNPNRALIEGADTLFAAVTAAAAQADENQAIVFNYGNNAYVYLQNGADGFSAGDGLVELIGVSRADLDATNFSMTVAA